MSKPARLNKVDNSNKCNFDWLMDTIEAWVQSHALLLLIISLCLLMSLFVTLCFAIVGVSAVESGVQYNAYSRII
jgi:hypothetical protein